jgi:hypothetical protein
MPDNTSLPLSNPSSLGSDRPTGSGRQGFLVNAVLYLGVAGLFLGVLIYFAARSFGGGLAGSLILGLIAWPFLEAGWSAAYALGRLSVRVAPHHQTIGGCIGLIVLCGVGGFIWQGGGWAILGLSGGALLTYVRRTRLANVPERLGLGPLARPTSPASIMPYPEVLTKILGGFLCLLIGVVVGVLGIGRYLEAYSVATDYGCAHPCGMVDGLWVEVTHDSQGRVVTVLDPTTVQLQLQFRDDTPGDKTIQRSDFRLFTANTTYAQRVDRPGCSLWPPQALRLEGSTGNLPVCFAISQADNADFSQLVLEWTQQARTVDISLGAPKSTGYTEIGITPTPTPP